MRGALAVAAHDPSSVSGTYTTYVGGNFTQSYCYIDSEGNGWTRVAIITLGDNGCVGPSGAKDNVAAGDPCSKASDAHINEIATEKIFFSKYSTGAGSTFTKYSGTIDHDHNVLGNVVQGATYASVRDATPTHPTGYTGCKFFCQQDWYQVRACASWMHRKCMITSA